MAPPKFDGERIKRAYKSYPATLTTGTWTVDDVRTAVHEHEGGNFFRSALLADAMGRDDRIVSALDTLILGILRLPFRMAPASEPRAKAQAMKVAADLARVWPKAVPDDELYEVVRWVVMMGFCLVELVWDTSDPERWIPERIRVWHPQFIYWREDLQRFVLNTADGQVEIDPADLGGKWLLVAPGGSRSWMRGAVRSLADEFVGLADTRRDWMRESEVHGSGIMKAKVPTGASDPDKARFVNSIATMGGEPVVECPVDDEGNGFDLEHLDTGKGHGEGFKGLLAELVANVNVRILGQNASTENAGPYVAKGGLFAKVTLDRIDGVVGPLEHALRAHIARPFAAFNYGDEELAPVPDYDSEPPPDKAAQAQTMVAVGQAVASLKLAGFDVDPEELTQRFGFTVRRAEQPAAHTAATQEVAA